MMLDGSYMVDAPVQEVWNFLIDIPRMVVCLPGMRKVEQTDEKTFTGVVALKLGAVTTSFKGTIVKLDEQPPNALRARVHAWDARTASILTGEFCVNLNSVNPANDSSQTQVDYAFELSIRGRLNQFQQSSIDASFQNLLDEFIACARTRIESPSDAAFRQSASPTPLQKRFIRLGQAIRQLFKS